MKARSLTSRMDRLRMTPSYPFRGIIFTIGGEITPFDPYKDKNAMLHHYRCYAQFCRSGFIKQLKGS